MGTKVVLRPSNLEMSVSCNDFLQIIEKVLFKPRMVNETKGSLYFKQCARQGSPDYGSHRPYFKHSYILEEW